MSSEENEQVPLVPEKEGYLTLLDAHAFKVRWITLCTNMLTCYESKESPNVILDVYLCSNSTTSFVHTLSENSSDFCQLKIDTSTRSIVLCGSLIEMDDWKHTIDSHIYMLKHAKQLHRLLNTVFLGNNEETTYMKAIIELSILLKCDYDLSRKLFAFMGYTSKFGDISRKKIKLFLERFQPIVAECADSEKQVNQYRISDIVELLSESWFSFFEDATGVESRLEKLPVGSFAIRFSTSYLGYFALCVQTKNGCEHFRLILSEKGYQIEEESFPSLKELVEYYKKTPILGIDIKLTSPCGLGYDSQSEFYGDSVFDCQLGKAYLHPSLPTLTSVELGLQNSRIDFTKAIIKEKLGSGGSGMTVYRCDVNGLVCAVKVMDRDAFTEEQIEHFLEEIQILKTVAECGHIVKYLHHIVSEKKIHLFMEYFPSTLFDVIRSRRMLNKPFSPLSIANICLGIIRGVHYLHSREPPIIHRDLKSANVFISFGSSDFPREVKLGDFGVSRSLKENAHTFIGTPGYMAPEIISSSNSSKIMNRKGYSLEADTFAFGMVLYELLALRLPFQREKDIFEVVMKGKTPMLPTLDETYNELVRLHRDCINYDPKKRPSSKEILIQLTNMCA